MLVEEYTAKEIRQDFIGFTGMKRRNIKLHLPASSS
jgi:hypothetical protein